MDIKKCFIDTETTGTDKIKNGIIQVSGVIDINGESVEEFDYKMKPPANKLVEAKALQVNGLDVDQINKFQSSEIAFRLFRQMLKEYVDPFDNKDKLFFLAYNSPFDEGFVRQWFKDNGDSYFGSLFWYPCIDVCGLAGEYLMEKRDQFSNFKLETMIKHFKIKVDGKLHDALTDTKATRELYYEIVGGLDRSLFN